MSWCGAMARSSPSPSAPRPSPPARTASASARGQPSRTSGAGRAARPGHCWRRCRGLGGRDHRHLAGRDDPDLEQGRPAPVRLRAGRGHRALDHDPGADRGGRRSELHRRSRAFRGTRRAHGDRPTPQGRPPRRHLRPVRLAHPGRSGERRRRFQRRQGHRRPQAGDGGAPQQQRLPPGPDRGVDGRPGHDRRGPADHRRQRADVRAGGHRPRRSGWFSVPGSISRTRRRPPRRHGAPSPPAGSPITSSPSGRLPAGRSLSRSTRRCTRTRTARSGASSPARATSRSAGAPSGSWPIAGGSSPGSRP